MAELMQLMTSAVGRDLLKAIYREPAVTAYNRLEPRPRTEDFERSLRAEVRDALWMMTRQWQMGEYESEDAGSAIDARLLTKQLHVDRIALRDAPGHAYDTTVPMEAFVEKETVPFTYALRAQIGQYFIRSFPAGLRATYRARCIEAFAMAAGQEAAYRGQVDGANLYAATRAHVFDGQMLLAAIDGGTFAAQVAVDAGDGPAVDAATSGVVAWFARQYLQPHDATESAWQPQQLDYRFAVAAPDADGTQVVLSANRYHQGRLDWWAFDDVLQPPPVATDPDAPAPALDDPKPISYLPTPAVFKGVPSPRFWEMEDRQIDFGKLNAKTTDHLLLAFAEFGLVYGNDWFVIPYKLAVNSLCEVEGLVITDVFGDRTMVGAADADNAGADNTWQRWSMFNLSNAGQMGRYNRLLFLPPTLVDSLGSDPIETVNLIRDEMANMVWGIEDTIPDATGRGISGFEAADQTGVDPPPIDDSPAAIRYVLGTTVPENWIPFLPVHVTGSVQEIRFRRAAMPKLGDPPREVVKAKGVFLTEEPAPYDIHEEEVPYAGTILHRAWQRARWYDGRTYVWIGRSRETGRGEGNSKLRFDAIEPTTAA